MEGEDRSIDLDGVTLHYTEWPGTSPPVVFLHGFSSSRRSWTSALPVRGSRRAFAHDARGHHESSRAPGTYTFVQHSIDAAAFLEQVVREPATLIGHSQGAMVATRIAALHPDLVLAVILLDPPLYVREFGLRDDQAGYEGIAARAGRPLEELRAAGLPPLRGRMLAMLDPGVPRQALDGSAFADWDTDAYLSAMRCPTLLIHGERALNSAIYEGDLDRATAKLSDVTVAGFQQAGHSVHREQPEQFIQVASEFLDRVAPPTS